MYNLILILLFIIGILAVLMMFLVVPQPAMTARLKTLANVQSKTEPEDYVTTMIFSIHFTQHKTT